MASNFTPKHIASAQLLGIISPSVLIRLLNKHKEFFEPKGVIPAAPSDLDYDRLSVLLMAPSEAMPAPLMADLFYWDEVADMADAEDLISIAEKHEIKFDQEATKEEMALIVRLDAPNDLEDLHAACHAHGLLRKKKRFLSYDATVAAIPKWAMPSQEKINRLERDMDYWYESQMKGSGTRITLVEKDDAVWFIVRHGETFKRENALEDGKPTMVFYRPEAYDLLIYHHKQGTLEIYNSSNGKRERAAYCRYFGKNLFGSDTFFESGDTPKYSLEPLRERGRAALDCTDVDGIDSARLVELRYRFPGNNKYCQTHKAVDVFTGLEHTQDDIPEGVELVYMALKIIPSTELGGERNIKLQWPNISVYDHENDAELAHRFLAERGFLVNRRGGAA
ncbi:MAG: hypothetical protein ACE37H_00870 [Phycisphaeraceae bacterium]